MLWVESSFLSVVAVVVVVAAVVEGAGSAGALIGPWWWWWRSLGRRHGGLDRRGLQRMMKGQGVAGSAPSSPYLPPSLPLDLSLSLSFTLPPSLSAASAWRRLDSSARRQPHVGPLSASGCGSGAHPLLDLGSHGHEGLLHIGGVLGTRFQEGDAQRVGKLLPDNTAGLGWQGARTAVTWKRNLAYRDWRCF